MVEFDSTDVEFTNFLKATSYIQDYTRRLLEKSTKRNLKVPDNLIAVNQLTALVKQFLNEQQELAAKVEKVHENQRTFNNLIKERLDNCKCEMELSVKSMLSKEINLDDLKRDDGTEFSLKIPTTSSFTTYLDPSSISLEADAQQRIDLELMKMMESVSSPYSERHSPEDNGTIRMHKIEPYDPHFLESSDKRKPSFKAVRRRNGHHESPAGPYQCRDCDKTFRQKHGLSQHLLTHESNGAFECDGCGKRYSRQESVYRHQRSTQCTKYQTLTNVRHEDPGPSLHQEIKVSQIIQHRAFLL